MSKQILLPLDGSRLSERALPYARALARRADARIMLVRAAHAHTVPGADPSKAQIEVTSRAEHETQAVADRLIADGIKSEARIYYDDPVHTILDAAHRHHANLIVMSTHGRSGLGRVVYGSVADDVLRHTETPVLLIPPAIDHSWPEQEPLSVLVPLDGSALAEEALGSAELLAEMFGARLHVLRVVESPGYPLYGDGYVYVPFDEDAELISAKQYLQDQVERLRAAGLEASAQVAVGNPTALIGAVARDRKVDVVAMATHGRGGLARMVMGSVATSTLQRAHTPLLLTRPTALGRPAARPKAGVAQQSAGATLTLTQPEVSLMRQAIQSLLLDTRHDDHSAPMLREMLARLQTAEQAAAETQTVEREVVGVR